MEDHDVRAAMLGEPFTMSGLRRFATFNRRETSIRVGSGPSSYPSKGAAGFEGYEAVDLIRRYPATARRSALLR